ncbi:chitin-binding domain protein cbd-1-like [Nilaparvata lugens]|uniref:chitin-binding domain protein cbd-1-like n=1 Tax=Nilaparvata lugens TaxID=108931 RepID=UPI00193D1DD8|nr:chitin-binding domain protein cbd-1-like [Nilaparvata lugens]
MKRVLGVVFYTISTLLILSTADEDTQHGEIEKMNSSSGELHGAGQALQAFVSKKKSFKHIQSRLDSENEEVEYVFRKGESTDVEPSCKIGQFYKIRYPGSCNMYYQCNNGTLTVEKCYPTRNFDVITHSCRFYWYVDCSLIDPTTTSISVPSSTTPLTTMSISTTLSSNVTSSPNSTISIGTTTTRPATTTSTSSTASSPTTTTTSSPTTTSTTTTSSPTTTSTTTTSSPTTTTSTTTTSTSTTEKSTTTPSTTSSTTSLTTTTPTTKTTSKPSTTPSIEPRCSLGQYYKIRYPGDCSKYYFCYNGSLTVRRCIFPLKFDAIREECRLFFFVDCSIDSVTTTTTNLPQTTTTTKPTTTARPDTTTTSTTTTTTTTTSTTTTEKVDPSTANPICAKGDNYVKRYPKDCHKYYQCVNGELSVETCFWWYNFDVITESCRPYYQVDCSIMEITTVPTTSTSTTPAGPTTQKPVKCESNEQFNYPDFTNCRKYYECSFGVVTLKECAVPFLFDGPTRKCAIFYIAICQTSEVLLREVSSTGEIPQLDDIEYDSVEKVGDSTFPQSRKLLEVDDINKQPSCMPGQYFKEPFPDNCNLYYECNNGTIQLKSCGLFRNFDVVSKSCTFLITAVCYEPEEPTVSTDTSTPPTSTPTTTTTLTTTTTTTTSIPITTSVITSTTVESPTTKADDKPTCRKGKNFKVKYPGTCNKYYKCSDGKLTVEECFIFFYFDEEYEKCRVYWFVECDWSPTTAPPTTVTTSTTTTTTTEKPLLCGPTENTNYPDPRNCKKYFHCEYGVVYNMTCASVLLFDSVTRKCALFYLVTCAKPEEDGLYLGSSSEFDIDDLEDYDALRNHEDRKVMLPFRERNTLENYPPQLSSESRAAIIESILRPISFETQQRIDAEVPSCKKGHNFLSHFPYDCQKYYKCEDGELTVETCASFYRFDYVAKLCRFYWYVVCETIPLPVTTELPNTTTTDLPVTTTTTELITTDASTPTSSCRPGQFYRRRHPKYCDRFYECKNGNITLESCPFLQNYDAITQMCLLVWLVDCNASDPITTPEYVPTTTTTTTTTTTPITTEIVPTSTTSPVCTVGQFYKKRHPIFCNKYYECNNGSITLLSCYYLRNFDKKLEQCRFYWLVDCRDSDPITLPPPPPTTTTTPNTTPTQDTSPTTRLTTPTSSTTPSGPICGIGMYYKSRYPSDCKKYYDCENGVLTVQSCSIFMSFDSISQTCRFTIYVDCDDSRRELL